MSDPERRPCPSCAEPVLAAAVLAHGVYNGTLVLSTVSGFS